MFSRCRMFWTKCSQIKCIIRTPNTANFNNVRVIPKYLGFSLFTWLGFDKKLSFEDELILTIKHCVLFMQRSDYSKAERLLHVALRQAQQVQHHLGITYIYDLMANLALTREELDKAKNLFIAVTQRLLSDGVKEDDPRIIHISIKLARISHLKKEFTTAQLGYDWCLSKLKKIHEKDSSPDTKMLLAITEDWYGRLYLDCNEDETGVKLLLSALNHLKDISDVDDEKTKENIAVQMNDIAVVYDRLDRVDDSINYFKDAIDISKNLSETTENLGVMQINLGRLYIKKNLLEQARKSCGAGWRIGATSKNKDIQHEAEQCLGEVKKQSKLLGN